MDVPAGLIREISAGNCVAFVGAGFSAPVIPQWKQLLLGLASDIPNETVGTRIRQLVERGTNRDLEAAAQTLRDAIGDAAFAEAMRRRLGDPPLNAVMRRRLDLLHGIPFRAILTTNFDGLLTGKPPGRDAYLDVLRPGGHRWWDRRFWEADRPGAAVVKLHGSVDQPADVVFTRQDYRRRLYSSPAYSTFLRSVMATTSVLYLGFSFNDAYLNELRSEILALLEHRGGDRPVAYALVSDASDAEVHYSLKHEGIHVLGFDTAGGTDFSGFDRYLDAIHQQTNPTLFLGRLLNGRRIVWVDPSQRSPKFGMQFLLDVAASAGGRTTVHRPSTADEGLALAREADLVVTHWGHARGPQGESAAEYLLRQIRTQDIEVPVMVFASGDHADENKLRAMRLGATSYEYTWEGLFQEISRIFRPGLHR